MLSLDVYHEEILVHKKSLEDYYVLILNDFR